MIFKKLQFCHYLLFSHTLYIHCINQQHTPNNAQRNVQTFHLHVNINCHALPSSAIATYNHTYHCHGNHCLLPRLFQFHLLTLLPFILRYSANETNARITHHNTHKQPSTNAIHQSSTCSDSDDPYLFLQSNILLSPNFLLLHRKAQWIRYMVNSSHAKITCK